jgi:hypothetical protein
MRTLRDVGPAKLLPPEQAKIRFAADSLLFCADVVADASARRAYGEIEQLSEHLVSCGRWTTEAAGRLEDGVWACGPGLPSLHAAAA